MAQLRALLAANGFESRVASTTRTYREQAQLRANYLAGKSRYPAAAPGHSAHERGIAFDLAASPAALALAGRYAGAFRLRWGGGFSPPDPVHFEALA